MEKPLRQIAPALIPEGTQLIETFGWWPGEGPRRWPLHRARLIGSAVRLGFACDAARLDKMVAGITGAGPLRCRVTLDQAGRIALDCTAHQISDAPWTLTLANERLRSDDPWLRVKSTRRALYDRLRQTAAPRQEIIFCNERGELCEGTMTNLFLIDRAGRKCTPALPCGLLPGVLRQELLAHDFREAILTPDDLNAAKAIFIGNSLRGLIRVSRT